MKIHARKILALTAPALLLACGSSEPMNIGNVGVLGASLSDYEGSWEGYAEAFDFHDGSDRVRLSLDSQGVGVLEVGNSAPLPAPDSAHGYPPSDPNEQPFAFLVPSFTDQLAPGFEYPVVAPIVEDSRIRFGVSTAELYREWCEGMTPVRDDVNSAAGEEAYRCLPNDSFGSTEAGCFLGDAAIDCGLLACETACTCDADACGVPDSPPDIRFDGALEAQGEELVGTLVMGERLTLRLVRQ